MSAPVAAVSALAAAGCAGGVELGLFRFDCRGFSQ